MKALIKFPFDLDSNTVFERCRVEPGTEDAAQLETLIEKARRVVRPKALYRESFIEARGEDTVTIEGVTFTSRALRANLDKVEKVFAYIATCGTELDGIDLPDGDFMQPFWLDVIKSEALGAAMTYVNDYMDRKHALGKTIKMSPGEGDVGVWAIEQQRELFVLLSDVQGLIGVELTDSCLMIPNKTTSGLRFPTEIDYHSCMLCHRKDCRGRSAPFNQEMWDSIV